MNYWQCRYCNLVNNWENEKCSICGSPRIFNEKRFHENIRFCPKCKGLMMFVSDKPNTSAHFLCPKDNTTIFDGFQWDSRYGSHIPDFKELDKQVDELKRSLKVGDWMSKNTPPPEKLSCRICGEPISNYQFEENDELCEECYEEENNTMEEEEFVSL